MTYDHWKATDTTDHGQKPVDDDPPEFWDGATGRWWITYDPPPIPLRTMDWHFYHDDYDGAPDAYDGRAGHGSSWHDCVSQIQEMEEEDEPAN